MLSHYRDNFRASRPGHPAIQVGRSLGTKRPVGVAEDGTPEQRIVVVTSAAQAFAIDVTYDYEVQSTERQSDMAG